MLGNKAESVVIDMTDKVVIKPQYDYILGFTKGQAVTQRDLEEYKTGQSIFPLQSKGLDTLNVGMIIYRSAYNKWGYMDESGNIVIEPIYSSVSSFKYGVAIVQLNGKMGVIDKCGKYLIEPIYEFIESDYIDGFFRAKIENGLYGLIDRNGKVILPFEYDWIGYFSEGMTVVRKNGKQSYIIDSRYI
ncbi:MAG: WG repeat-containing protein [Clostridiaceae bacterium]|nr:WG repeat-containing protein [Clostridiaceae bacterium]